MQHYIQTRTLNPLTSIVSVWGLIIEVNGTSVLEGFKAKCEANFVFKATA